VQTGKGFPFFCPALGALFQGQTARALKPPTLSIRDDFNHIHCGLANFDDATMISAEVVTNLDSMNPIAPLYQGVSPTTISQSTDHGKILYIEPFKKLFDSRFVWPDIIRSPLPLCQIELDRRLEWGAQSCGTVSECLIRDEGR